MWVEQVMQLCMYACALVVPCINESSYCRAVLHKQADPAMQHGPPGSAHHPHQDAPAAPKTDSLLVMYPVVKDSLLALAVQAKA